jgi:hypothetical protein
MRPGSRVGATEVRVETLVFFFSIAPTKSPTPSGTIIAPFCVLHDRIQGAGSEPLVALHVFILYSQIRQNLSSTYASNARQLKLFHSQLTNTAA